MELGPKISLQNGELSYIPLCAGSLIITEKDPGILTSKVVLVSLGNHALFQLLSFVLKMAIDAGVT